MAEDTVQSLLDALPAERERVGVLVAGHEEARLAQQPPSGQWSVLDHVRHMLFAEEAHLGRFLPGGYEWSPLGYTPATMLAAKRLAPAEGDVPSVAEVLDAWAAVHARTREIAGEGTPEIQEAIERHLRHQRAHVTIIRRLLR